ncbi:MAG: ABC transporter permease [Balneolaceae bacterium]
MIYYIRAAKIKFLTKYFEGHCSLLTDHCSLLTDMLYIKLAWRNIWRNKRRTLITMASVIMAVLLASVMSSMQQGQYDQMIDNTVGSFSGHIQVQAEGYFEESTLENSFEPDSTLFQQLQNFEGIRAMVPRIDSYALTAGHDRSRASMVVGIDVEAEKELSEPDQKIVDGNYFNRNDENGILVAQGLADFLKVEVGDTLVLLGQGFRGMSANGAFPISGIMKFGIPEMNNSIVYLPLETAQNLYGAYDRLTAAVILVDDPKEVNEIANRLSGEINGELAVLAWQTLMPDLVQAIEADAGSSFIILLILYMVVGFGILGTVLMMTAERSYEFGVMIAIGTARLSMAVMLILEMIFITLMGTLAGIFVSLPIIYYFNVNPLYFTGEAALAIEEYGMEPFVQFSMDPSILITQALIVLVLTFLISVYPILHMRKLKPVKAMRA